MSRLEVVPRGHAYTTHMSDGKPGIAWKAKYGAVEIDAVGKDMIIEGMNEKGLDVGLYYHPGFAEYEAYDPALGGGIDGSATDLGQYLLTNFSTVDEVREAVNNRSRSCRWSNLRWASRRRCISSSPSRAGKAIVIEYLDGRGENVRRAARRHHQCADLRLAL